MIDSPRFHFNLTKIGANQMVKVTKISARVFEKQNERIRLLFEKQTNNATNEVEDATACQSNSKPNKALFSARAENSRGQ